ncbi:FAD-dependent oxidoreductase [uncultured Sutterella sp.]|uniref:FAD-dependent oxidoreductase n=1 Tax=uncultured Sutterella sp. TaxID=286133 RepID=UPI0026099290|nr:FAD-dependent oxidoreductase [uncultured Sutterella sp.]
MSSASPLSLLRRRLLAASLAGTFLHEAAARGTLRNLPGFDIIIAGAGGAGLAAAVSAAENGASVLVLEKEAAPGGNTLIASGYYSAPAPKRQIPEDILDDWQRFEADILENAGPTADRARIRRFAREAGMTLEWLEAHGMRFSPRIYTVSGEHFPRASKPLMPNGSGYIRTLLDHANRLGVKIRCGASVVRLLSEDGTVRGVEVRSEGAAPERFCARKGVLIASGGYAASEAMISEFAPRFANLTHNNAPGITGEMLLAARAAGAALVDMEKIQCQPGSPPGRSHRVRLHNEVDRFILVGPDGRRFVREDARRDILRDRVLALPRQTAFAVVDDEGLRSYNVLIQKETVWGVETGDAFVARSIPELARAMGMPPEALSETIQRYNDGIEIQRDAFGKNLVRASRIATPPFWGCYAGMTRHACQGGIRVDAWSRVLRPDGSVIPGLYAAGEAAGSLHGDNQMGGNGLSDCLTFGRLAGADIARL